MIYVTLDMVETSEDAVQVVSDISLLPFLPGSSKVQPFRLVNDATTDQTVTITPGGKYPARSSYSLDRYSDTPPPCRSPSRQAAFRIPFGSCCQSRILQVWSCWYLTKSP